MKTRITNISAVGIIYRKSNPSQIFIEMKDDGHPIKLVRRQLCPIGGNWIGDAAKQDGNTRATFERELNEELSFDRPVRTTEELSLLGIAQAQTFAPTPSNGVLLLITVEDYLMLKDIKKTICESAVAFGDHLNTVPKSALDAADPDNKRDGFTTLSSYWTVGLDEDDWDALYALQHVYGNLSNESLTLMTSLDEIVQTNTMISFAHDRVLQRFFLSHGLKDAKQLPLVPGLKSVPAGMPLSTYEEYLERYDIAKKPI